MDEVHRVRALWLGCWSRVAIRYGRAAAPKIAASATCNGADNLVPVVPRGCFPIRPVCMRPMPCPHAWVGVAMFNLPRLGRTRNLS